MHLWYFGYTEWWIIALFGGFFVIFGIGPILFDLHKWRKIDLGLLLKEDLETREGMLTSIHKTRFFDIGPFPKFEFEAASKEKPYLRILNGVIRHNRTIYKKVSWVDVENNEHISWAKMEFYLYKLSKIEWKDGK